MGRIHLKSHCNRNTAQALPLAQCPLSRLHPPKLAWGEGSGETPEHHSWRRWGSFCLESIGSCADGTLIIMRCWIPSLISIMEINLRWINVVVLLNMQQSINKISTDDIYIIPSHSKTDVAFASGIRMSSLNSFALNAAESTCPPAMIQCWKNLSFIIVVALYTCAWWNVCISFSTVRVDALKYAL